MARLCVLPNNRSSSPRCKPNLRHANTLQSEEEQGGMENIDGSGLDKSEDDNTSSKRRKLSSLASGVALSGRSGQLRRSLSVTPEDGKYNSPERISDDSKLADISVSTPSVSETAPMKFQLYPQVMDANQEWEMREITGEEDVDGVPHYLVEWCPTLVPKDWMGHATELVVEFKARQARIRSRLGVKMKGRGRSDFKQKKPDAPCGQQKRPRRRPRKQRRGSELRATL
jgi:hypothetical protein